MPPTWPAPTPSAAEPAGAGRAGRELQHPRLPRRPPPRGPGRARHRPRRAVPAGGAPAAVRRAGGCGGSPPPAGCAGPGGTGGAAARRCSTSDRVRVVGSEHLRLPVRWPDRTRGYAVVRVALPGGARADGRVGAPQPQGARAGDPHRADPRGHRRPRAARARRRPQRGPHRRCLAAHRRARPAAAGVAGPADLPGAGAAPPARRRVRLARAAGAAAPRGAACRMPCTRRPATTAPPGSTSTSAPERRRPRARGEPHHIREAARRRPPTVEGGTTSSPSAFGGGHGGDTADRRRWPAGAGRRPRGARLHGDRPDRARWGDRQRPDRRRRRPAPRLG